MRFLQRRGVAADGGSFVSRHHYGAYLESLLDDAAAQAPEGALRQLNAEVVRIAPSADGAHAQVWLDDGSCLRADRVLLAIGNYPPEDPPLADRAFVNSPRYVRDPWRRDALERVDRAQPILLIGTGLTMVDIALQLEAMGVPAPPATMVAISRHGLLPQPHRGTGHADGRVSIGGIGDAGVPASARGWLRILRRLADEANASGADWRDVITALRPITPRLWQALSMTERARFLRHVRPFWEVHRHRIALQLAESFARLRAEGRVTILAGRLLSIRERVDGLQVLMRFRGRADTCAVEAGTVINCSGPAGDTRRLRDILFDRLRADGVLVPDALGLGIEAAADGAAIGRDGRASRVLYYVGPFLRARDWEATAVPELRRLAQVTVEQMLDRLLISPMSVKPGNSAMPEMPVEISWPLLRHLAALARRAGDAILACERPGCETKSDGSPVTAADRLAQDVICAELQRLDDTIPIIAEESDLPEPGTRGGWRRYWLVDPLDGTKEFLAGRPDYTVNIALIEDGVPVMGVVSAPALGEMYFAARGLGTWRQIGDDAPVRLIASCLAPDAGVRVIESRSHPSPALEEFLRSIVVTERIQLGSSLKFCRLAEGRADCYPRFGPTMSWDVAAGDCVFRNAVPDGAEPHASPLTYPTSEFRQSPFVVSLAVGTTTVPR